MNNIFKTLLLAACVCCGIKGMAQQGERQNVELGMELTSEVQTTHRGDCNYVNLLRLNASLAISHSVTLEAASLSTCMTEAESIGGDMQTFSNLDAGNIPFALSKCGIDWQINDHHSVFAGIRNMNEDYFASPVTSFYTNSSCGIYPTIGANYPIANYPEASMGVHYKYATDNIYVQASVYNGTGYHRFTGRENVFRVCPRSDGVFALAQLGYEHKDSRYFLGNALYSNEGTSFTPWAYAEQRVSDEVSVIAGYSHAFGSEVACRSFMGVGGLYEKGAVGIGVFTDYASFCDAKEWATELSASYSVTQNLNLQPAVHFIVTDGDFMSAFSVRLCVCL